MPTRSHRRNLRSSTSSVRTFISKPSSNGISFNGTYSDVQFYIQVETYLCNVIEAITNKIEFDKVIEEITIVQGMLKTKDDALDLLDMIQNTVLDILFNITMGVNLDIVTNRIMYLRELINRSDPNSFPIICSEVVQGISDILDMFGTSTDLEQILTGLNAIQERMVNDVGKADLIEDTHCALYGIIDNISSGVSLDIVNNRITYLQELVRQIQVLGIL